ncbi:TraB/GumN family protein [Desulfonatronovibrio magnus]|uniref:TraB/GumN family protein n=1 Tax=Desulfonatronovibrio magnus TaxID=698827 RepID=UPI0005EB8988|nr:TraB/GumN family protein [Desulfonatronovibrio magnus]
MDNNHQLNSENLTHVKLNDKDIYLLGTAHVSKQSVEDVKNAVHDLQPDAICVELCPSRYQVLVQEDAWQKMDIYRVVKENKALFLLAQLGLSTFYRKIGEKLGVKPGAEMLEGVNQAENTGARLVLADRDVNITLKRIWSSLSIWSKFKLLSHLFLSMMFQGNIEKEDIEKLKNKDQLQMVMDEFAKSFPQVQKTLVDERDQYLAHKISTSQGHKTLAIVGAAHVPGIVKYLSQNIDPAPLTAAPPPAVWPTFIKWGIPILIAALLLIGFLTQGTAHSVQSIYIWVLVNGIFSAIGVTLAMAHPLTILSAFLAAPITSLNPTMAAGWIAGLVQAWVKKPIVKDLENLPKALTTLKGFWLNPICRILLVVVLANLGSSLGTFVAGTWIATRIF